VFTARYALSPYVKQIRFVFKELTAIDCKVNRKIYIMQVNLCVTKRKCHNLLSTGYVEFNSPKKTFLLISG
jgi:hypothetical protein